MTVALISLDQKCEAKDFNMQRCANYDTLMEFRHNFPTHKDRRSDLYKTLF